MPFYPSVARLSNMRLEVGAEPVQGFWRGEHVRWAVAHNDDAQRLRMALDEGGAGCACLTSCGAAVCRATPDRLLSALSLSELVSHEDRS